MKYFIKFYFFPTFRKITVGGFVNQLIKISDLDHSECKSSGVHKYPNTRKCATEHITLKHAPQYKN